jgi:two-component system LytT family response regulator
VLFLDIRMPRMGGFEVLEQLPEDRMPIVIFVTAYDEFAVRAFEFASLDYLLKPFDRERFARALARVRERRQADEVRDKLKALLDERAKYPDRLEVKTSGRVVILKVDEIDWIDAAGNYVKIHAGSESLLLRDTMGRIEQRLDPRLFMRIHRSTIVNVERIRELQQQFHGDYVVVLKTGQRLTLSRSYRDKMRKLLERFR